MLRRNRPFREQQLVKRRGALSPEGYRVNMVPLGSWITAPFAIDGDEVVYQIYLCDHSRDRERHVGGTSFARCGRGALGSNLGSTTKTMRGC